MIRTVALLALVACASSFTHSRWKPGLAHTFLKNTKLPQTSVEAIEEGWEVVQGPTTLTGYDNLTLMIKSPDCSTGVFFDGNYLAGCMVALAENTTTLCYDATEQGLIPWTCSADGIKYLASPFFFVSEDDSNRTYDEDEVVQANELTFVGTNGTMDYISKNLTNIKEDDTSVWYRQRCVPLMGLHYYQNMTTSTTCDKPFPPYFGLFDDYTNQLIGVGFMVLGECVEDSCEHPSTTAVEYIVNNGPQCLYDMVDKCGACTHHFYFVNHPLLITCL